MTGIWQKQTVIEDVGGGDGLKISTQGVASQVKVYVFIHWQEKKKLY